VIIGVWFVRLESVGQGYFDSLMVWEALIRRSYGAVGKYMFS
jgi:hypothetical protein